MRKTKIKKGQPAKTEAAHQPAAPLAINVRVEPSPPDSLLELALKEPDRRPLRDYADVISVLRHQKKFTFREVAEWLKKHNVDADHNAVYREYTRCMPKDLAVNEVLADEHTEEEESWR